MTESFGGFEEIVDGKCNVCRGKGYLEQENCCRVSVCKFN